MAASSSNNESFTVEVGEEFPYPSGSVNSSTTKTKETEAPINKANSNDILFKDLHFWIQVGILRRVRYIIDKYNIKPTDKIAINGNTVLHVAVRFSTENHEILKDLLSELPEENSLLDLVNSDGSTLLHVAAIFGNTEAAKILLERNPDLLLAKDKDDRTPLALSLYNMHTDTSQFLINRIKGYKEKKDELFSGKSGDDLLVLAISSKKFSKELLTHYPKLNSEAVLMAIAQNFPSELKFWGIIRDRTDIIVRVMDIGNFRCFWLRGCCCWEAKLIFFLRATRQNACEVVAQIVSHFPNAIEGHNEDGHDFIQYVVINRSEAIYNLLYSMSEDNNFDKNKYKTINDDSKNNLLHLVAILAPSNKLKLISGAALQIQRELQWFKEVKEFVNPLIGIEKNDSGDTPEMVFTREHKDLMIEGEKWMKKTAQSYTITAALITTIVFAAAITVPGGNNQDTGIPIFTNNSAFTVFAISDAISLFAAVTSLLMFLSILTARFPHEDFLIKLPRRLIIGLLALFISTTTMIIAFGATLFLMFGEGDSRVLIIICVLTALPIIIFVRLQYPLIADLVIATYGPSIFDKNRSYSY